MGDREGPLGLGPSASSSLCQVNAYTSSEEEHWSWYTDVLFCLFVRLFVLNARSIISTWYGSLETI